MVGLGGDTVMSNWEEKAKQLFPNEFKEFQKLKGRRPDAVEFTSIEHDVKRRDLTINALFYDIEKKEVVDYVGGIEDIRKGIIRTVGSPEERFGEDRLRILRAARFAARAGSSLSPETSAAIKKDNSLAGVSPERIRDEFLKGIKSAKSVPQFLKMISEFDLWPQILPDLKIAEDFKDTNNASVAVAIVLRHNDPKVLIKKLNELKYSSDEVKQIVFLVNFQELNIDNAFKFKKMFLNAKLSNEDILEFAKLTSRPGMNLAIPFTKYELSVSGDELLKAGLKGAEIGAELSRQETELFRQLL